jgi:hypothetical protein
MQRILVFAVLMAIPGIICAEGNTFGLRLGGGYGYSMNGTESMQDYSESRSPGIPASAELMYSPSPTFGVSVGGFPIFMNRTIKYQGFNGISTVVLTQNESAVFVPYMVGLTFKYPLNVLFSLVGSVDAGYVPDTTLNTDNSLYGKHTLTLGGSFAWRSAVGVDWNILKNLSLGVAVQQVVFNMTDPTTQARTTEDFNQVAPMAALESRL